MSALDPASSTKVTLRWLLRLRWLAIAGQLLTMLFAAMVLKLELPWWPLVTILTITAFSNNWLGDMPRQSKHDRTPYLGMVMMMDVLLLTAILYWTGGAQNPFTSFYLLHIALAAMMLSGRWLGLLVGLCLAGYAFITFNCHPLKWDGQEMAAYCASYQWHLHGMAVAFFLTALCIAYFVARMHRALQQSELWLKDAELRASRGQQFAALATLSAGVAHELGSPLGTIAVASHELERAIESGTLGVDTLADARLIRTEVERCRIILDRLSKESTQGVGNAAESFTVERLIKELRSGLDSVCSERLRVEDLTQGQALQLPLAALVQAILILIQNGCQADVRGLPVTLRIACDETIATFRVTDLGTGLSAEALRHAGEPFFTTKPTGQGMGLGLFLVRTLAKQLGGELNLKNLPNAGASATFALPLAKSST